MARKLPPQRTNLELESTSTDPNFALSGDSDFTSLIGPLGTLPGGPYDYAYVTTNASTPGIVRIDDDLLEASNGLIASGNGKDDIDLSNTTGNNLVYAGNGIDKVKGGEGNDIIFGGNGNDNLSGGAGADSLDGGNGVDVLNGDADNDTLSGGAAKDTLAGGTDTGTVSITFSATDANGPVLVLDENGTVLGSVGAPVLGASGIANDLSVEGVFVDISTAPDSIYHVFSFTPADGPGTTAEFVVAVYDADGSLVDSFDVEMTEGVQNFFSLIDNDPIDDGGAIVIFAEGTTASNTLTLAQADPDFIASEEYEPVTLTVESVDVTAGDVLYGGAAGDVFVYNAGDGVDRIMDYKAGDKIQLNGIDPADVTTIVENGNTTLLFGDGSGGFAVDSAIELVGVTSQPTLVFS